MAGVKYGPVEVLQPLTTTVKPAQVTVVAGPNGAGKSTLLKLLTREIRPSRGTVRLDGRALAAYTAQELSHRRAVLPQSSQLAFPFKVVEVARIGLHAAGAEYSDTADLVLDMLRDVGLAGYADRFYHQLSGGERQRVHLARVLCQLESARAGKESQYLLLDEPTSSLDLKHQIEVLKIARQYSRRGVGVLAVLHDLNMSALFADRLIVLNNGAVAADGPPGDVITSEMVQSVFDVPLQVSEMPIGNTPFVLPHGAVR